MTAAKVLALSQAFASQRKAWRKARLFRHFLSFRVKKSHLFAPHLMQFFLGQKKPIASPLTSHMSKMAMKTG